MEEKKGTTYQYPWHYATRWYDNGRRVGCFSFGRIKTKRIELVESDESFCGVPLFWSDQRIVVFSLVSNSLILIVQISDTVTWLLRAKFADSPESSRVSPVFYFEVII
eukprot:scaffold808_cov196-Alexandrium_tamarense.AAC.85